MTDDASNRPGYTPHEIAAAERLLAREQQQAAHRGDERRRWLQRLSDGNDARERLENEAFYPSRDDGMVDHYDGDHAAVIAETPEGQRRDGWTVERRLLFLDRLAEHGSIISACRAVGVTRQSVYKLRPRAPAFAAAMDEAVRGSAALLADVLFDRALHGHQVPVLHQGEVVATRTVHHDALGLYLLRVRDPLNYAPIDELERWKKHRAVPATTIPSALPRDASPASLPAPGTLSTSTTSLAEPAGLDRVAAGNEHSPAGLDRVAAGNEDSPDGAATVASAPRDLRPETGPTYALRSTPDACPAISRPSHIR